MVAGEFGAEGSPDGVKVQEIAHRTRLEFTVDQSPRAVDALKDKGDVWRVSLFGDRLHIIAYEDAERAIATTTEMLRANGVRVVSAREGRFSLEDVFISIVERSRQEGKVAADE